jgi:hypothetical protein
VTSIDLHRLWSTLLVLSNTVRVLHNLVLSAQCSVLSAQCSVLVLSAMVLVLVLVLESSLQRSCIRSTRDLLLSATKLVPLPSTGTVARPESQ